MAWQASLSEMAGLGWALGMALFTSVYVTLYFVGMPCGAAVAPALAVAVAGITGGLCKLYSIRMRRTLCITPPILPYSQWPVSASWSCR